MSQRSTEFKKRVIQAGTKEHAQRLIPHNAKAGFIARATAIINRVFGVRA